MRLVAAVKRLNICPTFLCLFTHREQRPARNPLAFRPHCDVPLDKLGMVVRAEVNYCKLAVGFRISFVFSLRAQREKKMASDKPEGDVDAEGVLFCRADSFSEDGDQYWGLWSPNPDAACSGLIPARSGINKAHRIERLPTCAEGNGLVKASL
jgi:hypothetical protein